MNGSTIRVGVQDPSRALYLIVERPGRSYLVDGLLPYADAQRRLRFSPRDESAELPDFDAVAGLVPVVLGHLRTVGEPVN